MQSPLAATRDENSYTTTLDPTSLLHTQKECLEHGAYPGRQVLIVHVLACQLLQESIERVLQARSQLLPTTLLLFSQYLNLGGGHYKVVEKHCLAHLWLAGSASWRKSIEFRTSLKEDPVDDEAEADHEQGVEEVNCAILIQHGEIRRPGVAREDSEEGHKCHIELSKVSGAPLREEVYPDDGVCADCW